MSGGCDHTSYAILGIWRSEYCEALKLLKCVVDDFPNIGDGQYTFKIDERGGYV